MMMLIFVIMNLFISSHSEILHKHPERPIPIIKETDIKVQRQGRVFLRCNLKGKNITWLYSRTNVSRLVLPILSIYSKAQVIWHAKDMKDKMNGHTNNGTLELIRIEKVDEGVYECRSSDGRVRYNVNVASATSAFASTVGVFAGALSGSMFIMLTLYKLVQPRPKYPTPSASVDDHRSKGDAAKKPRDQGPKRYRKSKHNVHLKDDLTTEKQSKSANNLKKQDTVTVKRKLAESIHFAPDNKSYETAPIHWSQAKSVKSSPKSSPKSKPSNTKSSASQKANRSNVKSSASQKGNVKSSESKNTRKSHKGGQASSISPRKTRTKQSQYLPSGSSRVKV